MWSAKSNLASGQRENIWNKTLHRAAGGRGTHQNGKRVIHNSQYLGTGAEKLKDKCQMWKILNTRSRRRPVAETLSGELRLQTRGRESVPGFCSAWAGLKSHQSCSKERGFAGKVIQRMRSWPNCHLLCCTDVKGRREWGEFRAAKSPCLGQWEQGWEQRVGVGW